LDKIPVKKRIGINRIKNIRIHIKRAAREGVILNLFTTY
jgi:hypothetical protein